MLNEKQMVRTNVRFNWILGVISLTNLPCWMKMEKKAKSRFELPDNIIAVSGLQFRLVFHCNFLVCVFTVTRGIGQAVGLIVQEISNFTS